MTDLDMAKFSTAKKRKNYARWLSNQLRQQQQQQKSWFFDDIFWYTICLHQADHIQNFCFVLFCFDKTKQTFSKFGHAGC